MQDFHATLPLPPLGEYILYFVKEFFAAYISSWYLCSYVSLLKRIQYSQSA